MDYLRECVVCCGCSSFAVDSWRTRGCGAYFLTHAHADHLVGLSDAWSLGPLYCSGATRALLHLRWPALAARAHVLTLDEPVALALAPTHGGVEGDDGAGAGACGAPEALRVTACDAGHCPGAVGLLFEGACGRVFHTGDWRRGDGAAGGPAAALPACLAPGSPPLDVLHLDNTFCHPAYAHPPRAAAAAQLRALLTSARAAGRRVLLGVDTLGKEELLELAADATGGLVCVTPARLAAAQALGARTEHLTTEHGGAAVAVAPRWQLTPARLAAAHARQATLGVLPTGWPGGGVDGAVAAGADDGDDGDDDAAALLLWVPYSLHAPFAELQALVAALRPRAIFGVVASPRHAERPNDPRMHFAHLLAPPPPRPQRSPAASPQQRRALPPARRQRSPHVAGGAAAPGDLIYELRQAAAAAFCARGRRRLRGAGLALVADEEPPKSARKRSLVILEEPKPPDEGEQQMHARA